MRFVGHGAHRTMAETATALRTYGDVLDRRGYSFLAVTEREGGALIGDGGLHPLGGVGPDVELGYTLARERLGPGLRDRARPGARRATRSTDLGVPRVVAQVEPANAASRRVLAKLGMTEREVADGLRPPAPALRVTAPGERWTASGRALRRAARRRRGEAGEQRLGEPALAAEVERRRSRRPGRAR